MDNAWERLIGGVKNGEVRAMARLISRVENRENGWHAAMSEIYRMAGNARILGITGSPGAGKSTLTGAVTEELAAKGYTVGIIAVDPSSPFSGGALLGDRLRMQRLFTLDGVYIRSMATRGMLGGLCLAARDTVRIMDAFGKDIILIETVGVGQDEIEIVRAADRIMVVLTPGQGDGVQAIKAGIMEIADIYVVNKADLPGADEVVADIRAMLSLSEWESDHEPPVVKTAAARKQGIDELIDAALAPNQSVLDHPSKKAARIREEIIALVERAVFENVRGALTSDGSLDRAVAKVVANNADPYTIVPELLEKTDINIKATQEQKNNDAPCGQNGRKIG